MFLLILLLPIIILVLGILFVILSWTLPIGFVFTFLAFFLIILAIVTLVLSLKSTRKALSIIALVMSIHLLYDFACWSRLSSGEICHEPR